MNNVGNIRLLFLVVLAQTSTSYTAERVVEVAGGGVQIIYHDEDQFSDQEMSLDAMLARTKELHSQFVKAMAEESLAGQKKDVLITRRSLQNYIGSLSEEIIPVVVEDRLADLQKSCSDVLNYFDELKNSSKQLASLLKSYASIEKDNTPVKEIGSARDISKLVGQSFNTSTTKERSECYLRACKKARGLTMFDGILPPLEEDIYCEAAKSLKSLGQLLFLQKELLNSKESK